MDFDIITVQLVPEKKGLFLKHSEYEVSLHLFREMMSVIPMVSFLYWCSMEILINSVLNVKSHLDSELQCKANTY